MDTATKHVKVDPVCGMDVPDTSVFRTTRNGETYFFCSEHCRQTFVSHPSEYLIPGLHARERKMPPESDSASSAPAAPTAPTHPMKQRFDLEAYIPLFVLVDVCLIASAAQESINPHGWQGMDWMNLFMGWFMAFFATLKLFDLPAFADGFQRYDLLARRSRAYALVYPLIEFALAIGYLAHFQLRWVSLATVVIMLFGSLGVVRTLIRGEKMNCACMGNILNVPLSTVALLEDLAMAAMGLVMFVSLR